MTVLISQSDSYVRTFEATVTEYDAERRAVCLDRTAFYPGGGGQPCDLGTLCLGTQVLGTQVLGTQVLGTQAVADRLFEVTRTSREAGAVWHWLKESDALPVGADVEGRLDWDRRYALMRTHTALHVLCGVVWRDWGAQVTGGNMEPGKGRMDFEFARLRREMVTEIEARCNAEIDAAREVRVRVLPREEAFRIPDLIRTKINLLPEGIREIRTVELVGLDLQADGGTHVANTREIGRLRLTDYKSKGAINKRIYISVE